MTDFLVYNFKAGFILAAFYMLYVLFLRKESFFGVNRAYLLTVLVISFVLPALHISLDRSIYPSQNNFVYIEHTFQEISRTLNYVETEVVNNVNSFPVIPFLLLLGMCIAALRVGFQLVSIYKNIKKNGIKTQGKYKYVLMDKSHTTHSFFNFIFVRKSAYKSKQLREVLLHEQFHADCWHSIDLLLVGFLSILQWFNPFIYLFQRAFTETHEFQADQAVMDSGVGKLHYQKLLLVQAGSVVFAGLTSTFNQSLIKNRLNMMNRIKSKNSALIKYLVVVPVIFIISIVFAISQEKIDSTIQRALSYEKGEMSFQYEEGAIRYEARDSIESSDVLLLLYGDAKVQTNDVSMESKKIIINKNERMVYAFSEDNIPSIYPIEENNVTEIVGFGMEMHPILKIIRMHNGVDLSAIHGTPILATAGGIIRKVEFNKTDGNFIILDHGNEFSTKYSHLFEFNVKKGQAVKQGEAIGYVGNTGLSIAPHLYYEMMKDGEYVNPVDYLGKPSE